MTERIVISSDLDGTRADRAVAVLCGVSRAAARRSVDAGGVRRRDAVLAASSKVFEGDVLDVGLVSPEETVIPEETVEFAVAYEDDAVIVVDKPTGIVVHPGAGRPSGTLANGLLARFPEIGELPPDCRWGSSIESIGTPLAF